MKLIKTLWAVLGILLLVVLASMILIPFAKTTVWWIAAVCTVGMFAVCAYSISIAFRNGGNTESKLLGWPVFRVGFTMLAVQIVMGIVLMGTAKFCPWRVAVIAEVLICVVTVLGLVVKSVVGDTVTHSEAKVEDRTGEWKKLRAALTALAASGNVDIKKLAEEMRYADPMPTMLDAKIADIVEALKNDAGNNLLIKQLKDLLARRKAAAKQEK